MQMSTRSRAQVVEFLEAQQGSVDDYRRVLSEAAAAARSQLEEDPERLLETIAVRAVEQLQELQSRWQQVLGPQVLLY